MYFILFSFAARKGPSQQHMVVTVDWYIYLTHYVNFPFRRIIFLIRASLNMF